MLFEKRLPKNPREVDISIENMNTEFWKWDGESSRWGIPQMNIKTQSHC